MRLSPWYDPHNLLFPAGPSRPHIKTCHFSTACFDPSLARENFDSTTLSTTISCSAPYRTGNFSLMIQCPANNFNTLRNSSALSSGWETISSNGHRQIYFHFSTSRISTAISGFFLQFSYWKKTFSWASLVAQWLRVCLPMQGIQVRALVWEDPTCRGAMGP